MQIVDRNSERMCDSNMYNVYSIHGTQTEKIPNEPLNMNEEKNHLISK